MQIVRDKTNGLKAMKYAAIKMKNLSPVFNGMKFKIIDDFIEELKNDSLELDKRQPSDRMLKVCAGIRF